MVVKISSTNYVKLNSGIPLHSISINTPFCIERQIAIPSYYLYLPLHIVNTPQ